MASKVTMNEPGQEGGAFKRKRLMLDREKYVWLLRGMSEDQIMLETYSIYVDELPDPIFIVRT